MAFGICAGASSWTPKSATLVPSQAVQVSQSGPFVFVVKPDNTADLRPVKPGQRQEGDLTVVEGVKPDETVVVTGQLALSPGARWHPSRTFLKLRQTQDAAVSESALSIMNRCGQPT